MLKYEFAGEHSLHHRHGVLLPLAASSYLSDCTNRKVIAVTCCKRKKCLIWEGSENDRHSPIQSWVGRKWRKRVVSGVPGAGRKGWMPKAGLWFVIMNDEHCSDQVGLNKPFASNFLSCCAKFLLDFILFL